MKKLVVKLDWERNADDLKKLVLEAADDYRAKYGLGKKDGRYLRLAVEESMELLGHIKAGRPDEIHIEETDDGVRLRFITNTSAGGEDEFSFADREMHGVTGKLKAFYECGYEKLDKNRTKAEEFGVRKAQTDDLMEMGFAAEDSAYVWTLQSYDMTAFDHTLEENDEQWREISHSILANISEDIRLIIFSHKIIFDIRLATAREEKQGAEGYAISPDFDALKKIPVFKTPFQIKLVQLLYGGLARKQKSQADLEISEIKLSSEYSRKGRIPVLWYRPRRMPDKVNTVVFYHGGADLFPALPYHYRLAEKLVRLAQCQVFLVLHDLAPRTNPPVQILEGLEVYRQLLEDEKYNVSSERTALMGDSSGGTMTAAVSLLARDGKAPSPKGALLLYPSLDMRYNTESMKKYRDVPIVNGEAIDSYRKIVKSDWSEGNKYYMSPTEAESFAGLCDTYVETAEFDALHDEGVEYAKKLEAAGVRVVLNETKGTVHSFDMAKESDIVKAAVERRVQFLREIFK